ncbi:hypothetical protein EW146_g2348 [Bondarzewia mesenterica]|uniref:3-methyl-2-oxobutanoate hydroxymethyltransferase n=1 Tax=Bondarzewia mesenterica TaxID=1095465 RepID=A0A4S4M2D2_9AGAM|nr:hypothetical protein EW146_g2348 [Bondarzewia mesenterica]
MLTAYDYPTACVCDQSGIDIVLVGDSLAQVCLGLPSTTLLTLDEMLHHCRAVARGTKYPLLVGDMPFGSYQVGVEDAVRNAVRMVKEGHVGAVKLEGGKEIFDIVKRLTAVGIPVMAHVGLMPQRHTALSGYRVQGRTAFGAKVVLEAAKSLEKAGAFAVVLEAIPSQLGEYITEKLTIPTIGIGAGPGTSGQVLVWDDVMQRTEKKPKFVRCFAEVRKEERKGAMDYAEAVRDGSFPQRIEEGYVIDPSDWEKFLELVGDKDWVGNEKQEETHVTVPVPVHRVSESEQYNHWQTLAALERIVEHHKLDRDDDQDKGGTPASPPNIHNRHSHRKWPPISMWIAYLNECGFSERPVIPNSSKLTQKKAVLCTVWPVHRIMSPTVDVFSNIRNYDSNSDYKIIISSAARKAHFLRRKVHIIEGILSSKKMKHEMLSDSDSSAGDEENGIHQLTINEHYVKAYEYRKEREELAKLEEKYGPDASSGDEDEESETDSESDESEDEDGEELTPAVDAAIFRTLARIKNKDPGIYEAERDVFTEEHQKSGKLSLPAPKPKEKVGTITIFSFVHSKPLTLSAHRLATVLASSHSVSPEPSDRPLTHVEEQSQLRAEAIAAFHGSEPKGNDEDDEEGGLFTLREKTQDEIAQEEEEYRKYLEREVGDLKGLVEVEKVEVEVEAGHENTDDKADKKKKKKNGDAEEKEKKSREDQDQEFLLNYILNRGWIDKSSRRVPTYHEVTSGHQSKHGEKEHEGDLKEEEDTDSMPPDEDEFDDVVDRFESSYNHRFEEPDAATIPSFPREVDTVRRPSSHKERRKGARERRKERKREEKMIRQEEVKKLKGLKMRKMKEKLDLVGKEGGWVMNKALEGLDLEGDWDPDAYDTQMAAILQEVESNEASDAPVDDEKPTWDDDIDLGDVVVSEDEAFQSTSIKEKKREKKKKEKAKKKGKEVDEDGVDVDEMDADFQADGDWADEEKWDGTEEMRKRVLDKYMNELFELEFNDMVSGVPTRFHYTPVSKASYSLTPAEILTASDKDLNEFMGIKKYAPYRKEKNRWDANRGERLKEFKQKIAPRLGEGEVGASGERKEKKRKGKKEREKEKAAKGDQNGTDGLELAAKAVKEKRKRVEEVVQEHGRMDVDVDEEPEGEPAKKKRRRQKKSGKTEQAQVVQ